MQRNCTDAAGFPFRLAGDTVGRIADIQEHRDYQQTADRTHQQAGRERWCWVEEQREHPRRPDTVKDGPLNVGHVDTVAEAGAPRPTSVEYTSDGKAR